MSDQWAGDHRDAPEKLAYDGDLLRWLLRFPLQRIADLAAISGLSVPQTYVRIKAYEGEGLVASVRTAGSSHPSARVYYLTETGAQRLTAAFGQEVWSLARTWGADTNGLIRALPCLPSLLTTQQFVLALLADAPRMLGTNGHPAHIEWAWDRNHYEQYCLHANGPASARSRQPIRRTIRFDAHVRVRASQSLGSQARFYHFFVLHDTGFGDVRLVRHRLRALLRCRDTFEDEWPAGSFPTVLLIVPDVHRARLWQAYALRLASEEWLVHPLRGGIICLPPTTHPTHPHVRRAQPSPADDQQDQQHVGTRRSARDLHYSDPHLGNPWRLSWYALDRPSMSSLTDLLWPVSSDDMPSMFDSSIRRSSPSGSTVPAANGEPNSRTCPPPSLTRRNTGNRVLVLAAHEGHQWGSATANWMAWKPAILRRWMAWATQQIAGRHQLVLDLLAAHPLLSPADLAAVLDLDAETSLRYLTHLERLGLIRPDAPLQDAIPMTECNGKLGAASTAGRGYVLTQPAVYLLTTQAGVPTARSLKSSLRKAEHMRSRTDYHPVTSYARDVLACQRIAEHTRGVYTFFSMLHRALRTVPCTMMKLKANRAGGVVWWETDRACMRHYRTQHGWHAIRPDGAAEVVIEGRPLSFWLEWDRSTMGLRDLRAKFSAYAEYVRSREWRTDGNTPLPLLLIVTTDASGETRIAQALDDAMPAHLSLDIRIASATTLYEHGPLGNIWRPWIRGTPSGHVALGELSGLTNSPWRSPLHAAAHVVTATDFR